MQGHGLGIGIEPSQEQAIGQHLRERIGELLERQLMEHLVVKNLVEAVEAPLPVLALLAHQLLAEIIAQQPAAHGERQGKLLRSPDAFGRR